MPKKKLGNNVRRFATKQMPIEYAEPGQSYAIVEGIHGNCHFTVMLTNNEKKTASLTGSMQKKCRVKIQDLVLIEPISEKENGKYKIIFKYTPAQKHILEQEGLLNFVAPLPVVNSGPVQLIQPVLIVDDNIDFEGKEDIKKKIEKSESDLINELFIDDI
jgi:initiation factor 1A